jgi:hypothetical protein
MTRSTRPPKRRRADRRHCIRASGLIVAVAILINTTSLAAAPLESLQASTSAPHNPPAHPLVVVSITTDPNPDHQTIHIAWTAPHRDPTDASHPTITGYRVAVDQHTACRIDADEPPCCVVDGVGVGSAIKVAVVTDSGVGPWVSEAAVTAPASTPPEPWPPAHPVPANGPLAVVALFLAVSAVVWCRKQAHFASARRGLSTR